MAAFFFLQFFPPRQDTPTLVAQAHLGPCLTVHRGLSSSTPLPYHVFLTGPSQSVLALSQRRHNASLDGRIALIPTRSKCPSLLLKGVRDPDRRSCIPRSPCFSLGRKMPVNGT